MEPEVRTCTEDGWVITKRLNEQAKTTIHADSRKSWKNMCLDCIAFIDGHISLAHNSGSQQPPEPGENPRGSKGKGNKRYGIGKNDDKIKDED